MNVRYRRGWFSESHRHYLAAKGIKTSRYYQSKGFINRIQNEREQTLVRGLRALAGPGGSVERERTERSLGLGAPGKQRLELRRQMAREPLTEEQLEIKQGIISEAGGISPRSAPLSKRAPNEVTEEMVDHLRSDIELEKQSAEIEAVDLNEKLKQYGDAFENYAKEVQEHITEIQKNMLLATNKNDYELLNKETAQLQKALGRREEELRTAEAQNEQLRRRIVAADVQVQRLDNLSANLDRLRKAPAYRDLVQEAVRRYGGYE